VFFKENIQIGLPECLELIDTYEKILEKKRYPLLHIVSDYVVFTKETREFSASEEGLRFSKAEAYVLNSLPHKIIANFYLRVNKPPVPTKFFGSIKEAEEWLKNFL